MATQNHFHYIIEPAPTDNCSLRIVFMHGWGQSHKAFQSFFPLWGDVAEVVAVDFPGFGQSAEPTEAWGTDDYAVAMHDFLTALDKKQKTILIGHSFGCRVALRMAHQNPDHYKTLVLMAPAGLQRRRSIHQKFIRWARGRTYKVIKAIDHVFNLGLKDKWAKRYGSTDYNNASGIMRGVLVKTVTEDLSELAKTIQARVLLLCGQDDQQTPPEMALRYKELIDGAECHILKGYDHYTILGRGRHQAQNLINQFLETADIL